MKKQLRGGNSVARMLRFLTLDLLNRVTFP